MTTTETTTVLTADQRAKIEHFAGLPEDTILIGQGHRAWQIGRVPLLTGTSSTSVEVPVMAPVGRRGGYRLRLDQGNDDELVELLECGPFSPVWVPPQVGAPVTVNSGPYARRTGVIGCHDGSGWLLTGIGDRPLHFDWPELAPGA